MCCTAYLFQNYGNPDISEHSWTVLANTGLCTKNPVSTLTHRSMRPIWPRFEGFFETRETYFYS
jgi:hypothetical protein